MVRTLVSMFDDVSTRELSQRRRDMQTTAFGLMLGQVDVPDGLSSEFDKLDAELKRREVVFNQHRFTQPIASLLGELYLAIQAGSVRETASRLALGCEQREIDGSSEYGLNPKNPFFDEIVLKVSDNEQIESVTFLFRLDLKLDELQALVPDLAETEKGTASKTFSILRMNGNDCGKINFAMETHGNGYRVNRAVVTRL